MGHFTDFLAIFQNNFGDSWDIHGMWPIILGFKIKKYDGNKDISIKDPLVQGGGGEFLIFFVNF